MSRSLCLLLTDACNLDCTYCYQLRPTLRRTMKWATAQRAVDLLLEWNTGPCELSFSGGEPLLAPELLRRIVEFAESERPSDLSIQYTLTTNGMLLENEILCFLVDRGFNLRISSDGIRSAQDLRSTGSFTILDRLFERIRCDHPEFWERHLTVGITVTAATVPFLADSMAYFIDKEIPHIEAQPVVTWQPWNDEAEYELNRQIDRIVELSDAYWRRTGRIPVSFLHPMAVGDPSNPRPPIACGACAGTGLTVDLEGRAWGCHLFASSIQNLPPLGRSVAEVLDLGLIRDRGIEARIEELPRQGMLEPILWAPEVKHSPTGKCLDCRHVATCHICPASTIHIPANRDRLRMAAFPCAFTRATHDAATAFGPRSPMDRLMGMLEDLNEPMRRLEAVLPTPK